MIDKELKSWVDGNEERCITITCSGKDKTVRVFASTFEFGNCVGKTITDTDDITGQIKARMESNDRKELKRLKAKLSSTAGAS